MLGDCVSVNKPENIANYVADEDERARSVISRVSQDKQTYCKYKLQPFFITILLLTSDVMLCLCTGIDDKTVLE